MNISKDCIQEINMAKKLCKENNQKIRIGIIITTSLKEDALISFNSLINILDNDEQILESKEWTNRKFSKTKNIDINLIVTSKQTISDIRGYRFHKIFTDVDDKKLLQHMKMFIIPLSSHKVFKNVVETIDGIDESFKFKII